MKKIIILITTILLSTNIVNAEEKKTLADVIGKDCIDNIKYHLKLLDVVLKNYSKKKMDLPTH